jgi:hypothetical protein
MEKVIRNRAPRYFAYALYMLAGTAHAQPGTTLLHRAEQNLTRVIVHDIFSPPVASRIYLYANAAAYETLVLGHEGYKSLYGQAKGFPRIENPREKGWAPAEPGDVNYKLAALYAFFRTGGQLVFSEPMLKDSAETILASCGEHDEAVYQNSLRLGAMVSDSILAWSARDNYAATRKKRRYTYNKEKGKWTPTPPGYIDAVEPYWSHIRPVSLDSAAQFKPVPPPAYSARIPASVFMKEVIRSLSFDAKPQ